MKHLGAGILHTDGKKVLLLYRSANVRAYPHTWACAGGGIEDGENMLQAAERESKEEIGCMKGKKIAEFPNDKFVMYIYKVDSPFDVKLNDEHTESKWVKLDEVVDYDLHPNFKKEWPKYLRAIRKGGQLGECKSFKEWLANR